MSILLGVIVVFALLSAAVALMQAAAINRMAPAASLSWRGWLFGWWRFNSVAARAGLSGETAAAVYKRAVIACVTFVVLGLVLSSWAVNERRAQSTTELDPALIPEWQIIPTANFTDNSAPRPEAIVPGAALLES